MTSNKRWIVMIGLLVSGVFLFGAFRGLEPQAFLNSLGEVDLPGLIIGALVYFLAVTVIAWRWQFLLRSVQTVPLVALTQIVMVGYMGNNVYPLRAGEALRVYLLRRNHQIPVARATTTVVVERIFDGLVMLSFILIGLLFIEIESEPVRAVASFATAIFLPAMSLFFVLAAKPNWLRRLVKLVNRFLPGKLHDLIESVSEDVIHGLETLRSPVYLAGTIVASFLTWAIEAVVYWIVMGAFGLELGYPVALLVVGTVNLAGLIPASPGQVGVYEFFVSTVLIAVGIAQDVALAYAIVVHIVIWLPVTLAGFIVLARQGLGWSAISHADELETVSQI